MNRLVRRSGKLWADRFYVFSGDGSHLATLAVDSEPGAPHPFYSLHAYDLGAEPPASVLALQLPSGDIGDFVSFAPSGQRLVLNLTRLVDGRGYSIASVHDLATRASGEAEPARFDSFTAGFSKQGKGLLYNDFQDEFGTYGASFMDVSDPARPGAATFLFDAEGKPARAGLLNPDGSSFFAFTGNLDDLDAASQHGPVDCTRFDFGSGLSAPIHVARLSVAANVLNWLQSPDAEQLLFSTGIPGNLIEARDPLDYRRATAELGIYSLDLTVSATERTPVRLPTKWTAYDRFAWLPDSTGILREAPATDPSVVADTTANGQPADFVLPDAALVLEWILLGSRLGKGVSLAGLYGEQRYMTSDDRVIVPEHW